MTERSSAFLLALALALGSGSAGRGLRLHASEPMPVLTGYRLTSWGVRDGLPSATVLAVAQDQEGYLWVGTDAGLVRFDGWRFTAAEALGVSPLKRPIRALIVGDEGSLWIGYEEPGGVGRVHKGQLRHYGEADGLASGAVTMLFEDPGGTIWAGTPQGLFQFSGETWKPARHGSPHTPAFDAFANARGDLFVATAAGVFTRASGETGFQRVDRFKEAVRSVAEDPFGRLWVTDPTIGLRAVDDSTKPVRGGEAGRGNRLLADRRGNLWVGTRGQGLWRVRFVTPSGKMTIERATALTGMSNDGAEALLEDREGSLWVATPDGLNRLTPHKMTQIVDLGLVRGVAATPDGDVWVGTVNALVKFPRADLDAPREQHDLQAGQVKAMHTDDNGVLWIAAGGDLLRVRGGQMSTVPLEGYAYPRQIRSIVSDARGGLWLYDVEQGLLRWSGGRVGVKHVPSALRGERIVFMDNDLSGRLWFTFDDGRAAVLDRDGSVRRYGEHDGLGAGIYRAIHDSGNGVLWLGGSEGLTRLSHGRFSTIGAPSGLPVGPISAILEDDAGSLWLGIQGSAVLRIERSELERAFADASHQVRYKTYDRSDGFAGTPQWHTTRSAARARDGRLWFVSGRGVTVANPKALRDDHAVKVPVRIESVVADGQRVNVGPETSLPPRTERLEISYATLNLTSTLRTQFRYRLEGFDADWIDAGTRRQAFYTNLPPRGYAFRVIATNDDGTWEEPGALLSFAIRPTFYQVKSFYVACVIGLGLAVGGAWRFRLRQVRARFGLLLAERARLSREIHDTLLQSMVGVALQCDAIAADFGPSDTRTKEQVVRMRKSVEEYIRETRQSIWELRSPQLERSDLASALRRAGEKIAEGNTVAFDITVMGSPRRCSPKVEDELLRIGQEALANAARHAHATQIHMELQYESDAVSLRVVDNGRGFDPPTFDAEADGHYGLVGMKERAENVGGRLTIVSAPGAGTKVESVVPLSPFL